MGHYRSKLEIIADILLVVGQKAKKTHIMYKANLSFKVLERYLDNMSAASLIDFDDEDQCYDLSPKGQEFLEAYKDYTKTNKIVEKSLNQINDKKKNLEELCLSR